MATKAEMQKIDAVYEELEKLKPYLKIANERNEEIKNQRDAAIADLHAVCAGKFVDICCICGHHRPDKEGELKCELNGLICSWVWRGVQKRENEKDVHP